MVDFSTDAMALKNSSKHLMYKLFILMYALLTRYITQNGTMLKQVEQLKILPFILKAYINTNEKNERENVEDVILSILANMAFEETLREQIILFKKLNEVLDKIHKKKRDVLRLLANLTLSKNFDVGIILDSHIEQAFEALRDPEYVIDKETKEKTVSLTCISCLCVILNLTSKGIPINNKFLGLGLTRHLCNMIQNNVSDQKVVPLSFMILSNLLTYDSLADRIFNDTIDMLKLIHEMTFLKLKKDTKYNPEDKIFNKIFFLLSYTRFNLNCMLQGLMDKIRPKIVGFERYFEVFLEIFLNVDLSQNNLILLSGRIIYYMILHSEKLYDFLMKKDTFFKRLIQIIAADEYELVMKGKLDVFSSGVTKEKVGPLIANYVTRTTTNYDLLSANDPRSGDVSKSDEETYNEKSPSPNEPPQVLLNDKEKATSQSRMIAFLLLRLISKKEKNSKIFFIYRGLDHLIKYIYKLFQTEKKITEEERESIILFYANIIPSKQIQEKLQKILKFIITNFQKTFNPSNPDSILLACMQFFLNLSKNSSQHINIAKTTFLSNLAAVYRRKKPNHTLNLLIQILLSNISFTFKTHQIIIKSGAFKIVEHLDEKQESVKQYINISKLNMALNYKTFMLLQNMQSPLTSLPLMDNINPVGQIRLYLSALQYLIRDGPYFLSVENVPQDLFHEFSDPNKEQINLFNLLSNTQTEAEKKLPIIHVLKTCFKNLIDSLANNQSVYIIKRVVWIVMVLLDHPYLKDVPIDTPRLLIVDSPDPVHHLNRLLVPRHQDAHPSPPDHLEDPRTRLLLPRPHRLHRADGFVVLQVHESARVRAQDRRRELPHVHLRVLLQVHIVQVLPRCEELLHHRLDRPKQVRPVHLPHVRAAEVPEPEPLRPHERSPREHLLGPRDTPEVRLLPAAQPLRGPVRQPVPCEAAEHHLPGRHHLLGAREHELQLRAGCREAG